MKRSLLCLACGAFVLGAAEFVMMGILPQTAQDMAVGIPAAGSTISSYAIGVCVGTLMLVIARTIPPKRLIILFMAIALAGNLLSAAAVNLPMLLAARFIAGLPHGAFFGTATLIAKTLASPGKKARAVAIMVTGQTVANMLGVPAGTMVSEFLSWRWAFAALSAWAALTIALTVAWIPAIAAVGGKGAGRQFRFLSTSGPWLVLAAVLFGNTGIFCWWSYVSPWLTHVGGHAPTAVPMMMALAGFGMVVGGLAGGKLCDRWRHAGTAAVGQGIASMGLLLVFLDVGSPWSTAALTASISFGLFFISAPQQLLMAEAGKGGGELIGGAAVQVAFNFGNALGSMVGGATLHAFAMDYHYPALAGLPFTVLAVALLIAFTVRHERKLGRAA